MSLPKSIQKLLDIIDDKEIMPVETLKSPAKIKLGSMLLFVYDAKHKATLEFWDTLPIVIPIARYGDRFLGWNLHYCPYTWRISLAKELMKNISWKKRLTYKDVKSAFESAKVPLGFLQLTIRTYLYSHIRSNVKEFNSLNYELAIKEVMPRFKKETEENIYKILMSRFYKKIGGLRGSSKKSR